MCPSPIPLFSSVVFHHLLPSPLTSFFPSKKPIIFLSPHFLLVNHRLKFNKIYSFLCILKMPSAFFSYWLFLSSEGDLVKRIHKNCHGDGIQLDNAYGERGGMGGATGKGSMRKQRGEGRFITDVFSLTPDSQSHHSGSNYYDTCTRHLCHSLSIWICYFMISRVSIVLVLLNMYFI